MENHTREEKCNGIVINTYEWDHFQNMCSLGLHIEDEVKASEEELFNFRKFLNNKFAYPDGIEFTRQRGVLVGVKLIDNRVEKPRFTVGKLDIDILK